MAPDVRADESEGLELNDTIYALSSGTPPAAIAIVRVSGPAALDALRNLANRVPAPRRAALATLRHQDEVIDRALVLNFPGPASATGEDLVEFHLHGGRSVVASLLAALEGMDGLRPAQPGEFTRRAFENGRIDLVEAEGLADLLTAETQAQRRAALALAGGVFSRQIEAWQERLLWLSARVEAELDFSDEEDSQGAEDPGADLNNLAGELEEWLDRPNAERLRDGVRIVIAGPPNAGKSTLLNALAGREAAITSEIPGTTRDVIEAPVAMSGFPLLLIDTAGLRDSEDRIESIGIDRARRSLEAADLVLWLGDPEELPDCSHVICVTPKADLEATGPVTDVRVSAVTGEGLRALTDLILARVRLLMPGEGEPAIHQRHRLLLGQARDHLRGSAASNDLLIVAEGLRQARGALDQVTGRAGTEHMLDALFGRLCIGK